jgi:pyruvate,water dikinase
MLTTEPPQSLFWQQESMHWPSAVTTMEAEVFELAYGRGFCAAAEQYSMPVRLAMQRIDGYMYQAVYPVSTDPQVLAKLGEESGQRLMSSVLNLRALWESKWLPAIQRFIDTCESFDDLDRLRREIVEVGRIHFELTFPYLLALSEFQDFYLSLFGGGPLDAYRLLEGFPNKTTEKDFAIWQLAQNGGVGEEPLETFLEQHGGRGDSFIRFGPSPLWREDPGPLLATIQNYIDHQASNPMSVVEQQARTREQELSKIRACLKNFPAPVVERFEAMLASAQFATVLHEDHDYWIDNEAMERVRRIVLAYGARLASEGLIETASDVWHLSLDELEDGASKHKIVAARKADCERYRRAVPLPVLGTPPPGPPPDDPLFRAVSRFFGTPPQGASINGSSLLGHGASAGRARGCARVITSLADASRFSNGDILVAETTAPAWTPLLAVAAAVITDHGGILSHCAVVAREYGVPAVVGTGMATKVIPDGALVEVDGSAGTVMLL